LRGRGAAGAERFEHQVDRRGGDGGRCQAVDGGAAPPRSAGGGQHRAGGEPQLRVVGGTGEAAEGTVKLGLGVAAIAA
jgi:hypothetical protein